METKTQAERDAELVASRKAEHAIARLADMVHRGVGAPPDVESKSDRHVGLTIRCGDELMNQYNPRGWKD